MPSAQDRDPVVQRTSGNTTDRMAARGGQAQPERDAGLPCCSAKRARHSLLITPTPTRENTAPIRIGILPPRAPAVVTVTTFVRNAITRLPITPLVSPAGSVPAAPAVVPHQLHGRCRANLNRGKIGRERSRLCRCRQSQAVGKRQHERTHCCLQKRTYAHRRTLQLTIPEAPSREGQPFTLR